MENDTVKVSWDGFTSGDDAAEATCGLFGLLFQLTLTLFVRIPIILYAIWKDRNV